MRQATERHQFQVPEPKGFPLRITRREFVVSAGALVAAGALFGPTSLALADPTPEELMRAGPLPDMVLGKADAPVTIVEYASMTCPHCANFDKTTFPALKSKYIDTGKVRFIFREFPLDELAVAVSMLVRCAATDKATNTINGEKANALIEVFFASQDKWATRNPIPALQQITKQAGLSDKSFDECLKDQKLYNDILAMRERGSKEYKVESTPTIFINGKMQRGETTIEELAKVIDPLLPKS
jgi:protein-disulfide isomerase